MESFSGLSLGGSQKRKLIVGIDFGTTYSGIAWAETRRSDHQTLINVWPMNVNTQEGKTMDKVPTEIRYTPQGIEWGFQIPNTVERHQWFKLGLVGGNADQSTSEHSPEALSAAYLTALHTHLKYTLEQKLGASLLRSTPIEYCLTVPAMWSELAKQKTLAASTAAGLNPNGNMMLVSEPEAAAVYALHGLDPHDLKINDSFVLCDAGGGTVDLITYTITQLRPRLEIIEAAPGTGGLCGSTFLNRRFSEFMSQKLGNEEGWDDELEAEVMERFDLVVKKQYSPSTMKHGGYTFLVPGIANNDRLGIKRGRLLVTPGEMKRIFEPVISEVIALVQGQIRTSGREIRAVLLVGGFGENSYLKERLRGVLHQRIQVLQPPNAWTAVARGAVMMGLGREQAELATISVMSRSARKHYGMSLRHTFDESKHDEKLKYWCSRKQKYKVPSLDWFIKKGEPVAEGQPTKITFNVDFLISDGKPDHHSIDVKCDEYSEVAPVHYNNNVRSLVTLKADLSSISDVDLAKTERQRADGLWYYSMAGHVEATYRSASTQYVLVFLGQRYDTVTAEYV